MANILVIAPHADDEVLGCAGTMKKHSAAGDNVFVAIMTNAAIGDPEMYTKEGIKNVRKEAIKAHMLLGVKETFFFDFPAPRLDTFPSYKISIELNKLINDLNTDLLFIPHRGDIHRDHRVIFDAAMVAARPNGKNNVRKILSYETLSETEWAAPVIDNMFIPNCFNDISQYIEIKIEAFQIYKSQIKLYPNSRSVEGIRSLSAFRGVTISCPYAEAFMILRELY